MTKGPTIGITGGIGAGKSVVARILRCNGFEVYDCDSEAKRIMVSDKKLGASLENALNTELFDEEGNLQKKKLASIIFSEDDKREMVNSLVHKAVTEDIHIKREQIKGWFFIESAILETGGITPFCDKIWIVESPIELRFKRIGKRDSLDKEQIEQRVKVQKNELSGINKKKTLILENDDKHSLVSAILQLIDKINYNQTYLLPC